MIKKPQCTSDNQGIFTIEEIDGKTAFIFDSTPAVLFISCDGTGSHSYFFRHGDHMSDIQSFKIEGELGSAVTYELDFNALVKPE